jgi:hypothetical protein
MSDEPTVVDMLSMSLISEDDTNVPEAIKEVNATLQTTNKILIKLLSVLTPKDT